MADKLTWEKETKIKFGKTPPKKSNSTNPQEKPSSTKY